MIKETDHRDTEAQRENMRKSVFSVPLCLCGLILFFAGAVRAAPPRVFLLNGEKIADSREKIKNNDPALAAALDKLKDDAKKAMTKGPFSVVDKPQVPPSGNKHDYMSQAPYFWPDTTKPSGLPYIRKDGEKNPDIKLITD